MSLPTYQQAVSRPAITEVAAPYLEAHDLAAASRVSKSWHASYSPLLWAEPLKALAKMPSPYGRTYRFFQSVRAHGQECRSRIQILDFRPLIALKKKYPQDFELNELVLNGLYILGVCCDLQFVQHLVMDGIVDWESSAVPFANEGDVSASTWSTAGDMVPSDTSIRRQHTIFPETSGVPIASKASTQQASLQKNYWNSASRIPQQPLPSIAENHHIAHTILPRLFSIEECSTIDGMQVICFPIFAYTSLVYLDLSYTANSEIWSRRFSDLPLHNIRVLKLQGLRLTDRTLPRFLQNTEHRLWCLDLRDNVLTDMITGYLLTKCFLPYLPQPFTENEIYQLPPNYEHQLTDHPNHRSDSTVPMRFDTKDTFKACSTKSSYLDESDPLLWPTGLTHLYISENKLTSEGVERIVSETNRLQVLDVGTVREARSIKHSISWAQRNSTPYLQRAKNPRLVTLRIHHSIVTCTPTISPSPSDSARAVTPKVYAPQYLESAESFGRETGAQAISSFSPMMNAGIETLTLTGLPSKSHGFLLQKIVALLSDCREQELAILSACKSAHRRAPEVLRGLQALRLEFIPADDAAVAAGSVSGDRDAERFLAEGKEDFSFFPDEEGGGGPERTATVSGPPVREPEDIVKELKRMRGGGLLEWGGKLELVMPRAR